MVYFPKEKIYEQAVNVSLQQKDNNSFRGLLESLILRQQWRAYNLARVSSDTFCEICGKGTTKKCTKCKNAYYCSEKCQTKGWREDRHKDFCQGFVNQQTMKNLSFAKESLGKE